MLVKTNRRLNLFYMGVSGTCVGLLAGLSLSPVVHDLLSTLTTLVVATTGVLAGLEFEPDSDPKDADALKHTRRLSHRVAVDPLPMACVFLGIVFGAGGGLFTRTHNFLGVSPSPKSATIESEVGRAPSQSKPVTEQDSVGDKTQAARLGVLYRNQIQACKEWRVTPSTNLMSSMVHTEFVTNDPLLLTQINDCTSTACLERIVDSLCGK